MKKLIVYLLLAAITFLISCSTMKYESFARKVSNKSIFDGRKKNIQSFRKELVSNSMIKKDFVHNYLLIEYHNMFSTYYWGVLYVNDDRYAFKKDSINAKMKIDSSNILPDESYLVKQFNNRQFERIHSASIKGCNTSSATIMTITGWKATWFKKWKFQGCSLWVNLDGSINE